MFRKKFEFSAPVLGWGRFEHFEYGCCIAFSDRSLNVRSYVITTLIAVFFLPICRSLDIEGLTLISNDLQACVWSATV